MTNISKFLRAEGIITNAGCSTITMLGHHHQSEPHPSIKPVELRLKDGWAAGLGRKIG